MPNTMERDNLVIQCSKLGIDHTGTTHQLRKRLIEHLMPKEEPAVAATPVQTPKTKEKKREPTA